MTYFLFFWPRDRLAYGPPRVFFFKHRFEENFERITPGMALFFLPGLLAFLLYIPLYQVEDRLAFLAGSLQNVAYLLVGIRRWFFPEKSRLSPRHLFLLLERDRETPILQICYDVGFNSPSSFHTAFKTVTGLTPAAFRKKFP